MTGPQRSYPSGFPNAQQPSMRSRFGSSPQMPGLIPSPPQGDMVNQTPCGVSLQQTNQSGLIPPQQTTQLQMQQLQQQDVQQQRSQNNAQSQANQPQQQLPAQSKEFYTARLCRQGQETVKDIVKRTQEVFQMLKAVHPPNGTAQGASGSADKKSELQEQLRTIRLRFRRLRLTYEKCNKNCQGMEYTHIESLIPVKEKWDMKSDEEKTYEQYPSTCVENKEVMEQVILKNRHLEEIINLLRKIIWEINTMLTMRRS